jgi:hypothetical protein
MYKVERLKTQTSVVANTKDCANILAWDYFLLDVEDLSMNLVDIKRNWVSLIRDGEIPGYARISEQKEE